ncbi:MAG: hypothetical protein K2Y42_10170 [Hyphomicrobium sp.]|jgi:hypothetical protein|uniref:hypothetical protein n=1 Tax=Hyphomicrobium sp. TaxID=82 RepID=UPI0025C382F4|nr:hypothetical protein [Hyphomicrobium sp.]MBX9863104.1 hypothetical protein [Hyphomicrobium sp.]
MSLWQRAIAIFVLMVFTPASVLAGTPLRMCIGSDGHRAIEFVLSAEHHSEAQHAHLGDCGPSARHVAPSPECTDSPLLSVAQKPNFAAQAKFTIPLDDLPVLALPPVSLKLPAFADAPTGELHSASVLRRDSRLDALRTIVLLI